MWRAFFFAIGVSLILLGAQCLVVDRYYLTENSKITQFFARALDYTSDNGSATNSQVAQQNRSAPSVASRSPFGPSRFQQSPFDSNGQSSPFYGGRPSNENGRFQFSGFTRPLNTGPSSSASQTSIRSTRVVKTRDWMPWSLLAAGAIVVLYTNVSTRRFSKED